MERVAAIYDIHGNLPALEAVLEDVRRADVDLVVVGGDVLPGPMPRETLDCLFDLDLPIQFIRGNGDRITLEEGAGEKVVGLLRCWRQAGEPPEGRLGSAAIHPARRPAQPPELPAR